MFDNISLKKVNRNISFSGKNHIFKDDIIPDLQAKGVTAICKILHNRQYAYLADEVGMGKTYQAIGVISMLFAEKKDAKVLIIAPNETIQRNWSLEIKNFTKYNDLINILNVADEDIRDVHPVEIIEKHVNEKKDARIDIVRLTSFSTIANNVARKDLNYTREGKVISLKKLYDGITLIIKKKVSSSNKKISYFDAGKIIGSIFRNYSPLYDLVIIDEAQNIRNENNATAFLNYWLGLKRFRNSNEHSINRELGRFEKNKTVLNCKYLLLSATPAHRGIESLKKQLLYFENEKEIPSIDHEYLEKFMIRRLRTYNNNNKYSVRNVQADDVAKDLSTEKRLFLALIQSKLAQIQSNNNSIFKIGFLETFESYDVSENQSFNDEETGERDKEFENGGSSEKDEKGSALDKKMLKEVAKSYGITFKSESCPPHPKLDYMEQLLEKDIDNNLSNCNKDGIDKSIIFVRRLASVNELVNNRLNRIYEKKIISYWGKKFGIQNANINGIQKEFQRMYKERQEDDSDDVKKNELIDENIYETKSKLISWMSVKKSDKKVRYNCVSLFKKSIMNNKTNSYIFDENHYRTMHIEDSDIDFKKRVNEIVDQNFIREVSEYINSDKNRYFIQEKNGKRKLNNSNLLSLCCYIALSRENNAISSNIKKYYEIKEKVETSEKFLSNRQIEKILMQPSLWYYMEKEKNKSGLLNSWFTENYSEFSKREVIKKLIEKFLKSSEAVLILLFEYCENKDKNNVCKKIWESLCAQDVTYGDRIQLLLNEDTALLVCNQLLEQNEINYEYNPSFMNSQQWVMPAIGGNNGNTALIKRFNTPFYPDIIVCTDVLKEGINLHLFCSKVFHYGLAWTPGDLEQRIGRVDRFFSKTHRAIMEGKNNKIDVIYPYMGKSVDEQQLRKVLSFKLLADPLLDSLGVSKKEIEFNLTDSGTIDELLKFIPLQIEQTNFPYSGEKFWKE